MRYQFYREHKYVSAALNDFERLVAKADFCSRGNVEEIEEAFEALEGMLKGHADYENERLHALLKQKNVSTAIYQRIEEDHVAQDGQLAEIKDILQGILHESNRERKIEEGYRLYLIYRKFVADNLSHLHEEETQILPELQRLYTDEELKQVEADAYRQMSSEEIMHMITLLFPHMNRYDRQAFLFDIRALEPKKFDVILKDIQAILTKEEYAFLR